jgi:hypothetical protein
MRAGMLALCVLLAGLAGCAHHTVKVKCDGPLRPINQPAPREAPAHNGGDGAQ